MAEGASQSARGGGVNISTSFLLFADNFYEMFQDAQFFSFSE